MGIFAAVTERGVEEVLREFQTDVALVDDDGFGVVLQEEIIDQAAFARPGHAGDAGEHPQRNVHVHIL